MLAMLTAAACRHDSQWAQSGIASAGGGASDAMLRFWNRPLQLTQGDTSHRTGHESEGQDMSRRT